MLQVDIRQAILDAAEPLVRADGYAGFGFPDVARGAGITLAALQSSYPTRVELAAAVARRQSRRFFDRLGSCESGDPALCLDRYVAEVRQALGTEDRLALPGLLSVEGGMLPRLVLHELELFVRRSVAWLRITLSRAGLPDPLDRQQALLLQTALEGALTHARATGDCTVFDTVAQAACRISHDGSIH